MDFYLITEISKIGFLFAAVWAIIQFWSANEFKKAQHLSELWRKFYSTDKFVEIFDILDRNESNTDELNDVSSKDIFSYLAFLEEIVIFRRTKFYHIHKLSDENLINLFQYHFYNVYFKSTKNQKLFWKKINEKFDINNPSWKFQADFAKKCAENIDKN